MGEEIIDHILFVGNPGTGKSTLLNSLIGSVQFKSGISYGGGLTSCLQWHDHSGIRYYIISQTTVIGNVLAERLRRWSCNPAVLGSNPAGVIGCDV